MRSISTSVLGICTVLSLPAFAAEWSDTFIGYRYGTAFQEPAIDKEITKHIVSLGHASGYSLGSNFFNVDMLKSDRNDPSNGSDSKGAQEVYAVYRHSLSLGKAFHAPVKFGPVRDISFTAGFDYSSKNTQFAPGVRKLLAGPTIHFNVPKGFLDLGLLYYREKNHNSFGDGADKNVTFDSTYQIAAAWGIPIQLGSVSTNFKGMAAYTGSKGEDAIGKDTKPETLVRAAWLLDAGAFAGKKGTFLIGPGFEYWHNKFGNASPIPPPFPKPNHTTHCVTLNMEVHF